MLELKSFGLIFRCEFLTYARMKLFTTLFHLLFIWSIALSQSPGKVFPAGEFAKDYNVISASGKREGVWIRVYASNPNVMYYKGQFKAGVPTGVFEFYAEDGNLKSTVNHLKDTSLNEVVNYFPNGKSVMSKGQYIGKAKNGKWQRLKSGEWNYFNEGGATILTENYLDGDLHGVVKNYFENGVMSHEKTYKNGLKYGPFSEYSNIGVLIVKGEYLKDQFNKTIMYYTFEGKKMLEGNYVEGVKKGIWKIYNEYEQVEKEMTLAGEIETAVRYANGTFKDYYEGTNIPKSEYKYVNYKKNGPFTEWYKAGRYAEVEATPEEAYEGIAFKEVLVDTKVSKSGTYLNDKLHGEIKYFKLSGELEKIEVYENGVLKSTK